MFCDLYRLTYMRLLPGRIVGLVCLATVGASCAVPSLPPPVPVDNRIMSAFEPLRDLTGQYDALKRGFDAAVRDRMQADYVWSYEKMEYPVDWQTEFITNIFTLSPLAGGRAPGQAVLLFRGSVEQIEYGSPKKIKEYIVDWWLFGIWGDLLHDAEATSDRAAFVEYRLELYDVAGDKVLETWLIQGAYRGRKTDRSEIIAGANDVAADRLIFRLNNEISYRFNRQPSRKRLSGRWRSPPSEVR